MTRKRVAVILALALSAWLLAGCTPKGEPCKRVGDTKTYQGNGYTCQAGPNGNTWQTLTDLGVGTWSYHGHGH